MRYYFPKLDNFYKYPPDGRFHSCIRWEGYNYFGRITNYCGGCITAALPSIIEKKVNKNSENIKRNTVL